MEQYIALLLMILPGFAAHQIYERMNSGTKAEDTFDKTAISLLYSVGVLGMNYFFIWLLWGLTTISQIMNSFNRIGFILSYILITVASCLIVAVIWNFIYPRIPWVLNLVRRIEKKPDIGEQETVWDHIFRKTKYHAVSIERDGVEIVNGIISGFSFGHNTNKEFYIEQVGLIKKRPELFDEVKGVYIDCQNNLIIKEYDLKKAYSEMDSKGVKY
jgi:hypothetical protein